MDDLISREQAIDALAEDMPSAYAPDGLHPADEGIFMVQEIYADCIQTLKELPSAQSDIIRCKDCKHHWTYKSMDRMPIERCDLEQTFYDAEIDYCSLAERREDG